jgi:hypothetical protein
MNRKSLIIVGVIAIFFLLSLVFAFAQEKQSEEAPCGCEEEKIERDDSLKSWIEESTHAYETEDGNLYWWLQTYNDEAKGYEGSGDDTGLIQYLREIADHYEFGDESDENGFIEWALKTRPWSAK